MTRRLLGVPAGQGWPAGFTPLHLGYILHIVLEEDLRSRRQTKHAQIRIEGFHAANSKTS